MVGRLTRSRALESERLFNQFYLCAIDATGHLSFSERHCPHCLVQHQNGKTTYYHMVLESKLVTSSGMAFSASTEFVENADARAEKQDCELAALARLLPKMKGRFPRLRICLLLDALYANKTVFSLCERIGWRWIVTFKEGRLPTVFDEFHRLKALSPENCVEHREAGRYQRLSWVEGLEHEGHRFWGFDCLTYDENFEVQYFAWATNLPANRRTVVHLANKGGRLRSKIENEGFNVQKNHGYALEHAYSHDPTAIKNYYFLLQIAHTVVQLMIKGGLRKAFKSRLRTLRNFFRRLAESLRNVLIEACAVTKEALRFIQIRLDTS